MLRYNLRTDAEVAIHKAGRIFNAHLPSNARLAGLVTRRRVGGTVRPRVQRRAQALEHHCSDHLEEKSNTQLKLKILSNFFTRRVHYLIYILEHGIWLVAELILMCRVMVSTRAMYSRVSIALVSTYMYMGHPFMSSTRFRLTQTDGDRRDPPMWTSTQKLRSH